MTTDVGFTPPYDHPTVHRARACTVCAEHLPLGPRPIFRVHPAARIALISQAPGRIAHLSDVAWDDPGGRQLRQWLGVGEEAFFRSPTFAVLPIGFCYPGKGKGKGKGGDLPPRPECAPLWQDSMLRLMPDLELKILIGAYSQRRYLGKRRKRNLTETVRAYEDYLPEYFPIPHPSPRNKLYLRRNPWIEADILPALQRIVQPLLP